MDTLTRRIGALLAAVVLATTVMLSGNLGASAAPLVAPASEGSTAITAKYATSSAVLGAATSSVVCGLVNGGCFQSFERGAIHWSAASGAHWTRGVIRSKWAASGTEGGRYGYPLTDELCRNGTSGGTLCTQSFQRGTIKWRSDAGIIDCAVLKCVALTFDDAPGPLTDRLLDTLDSNNVQATFSVLGQNVDAYASTLQRAHANGNEMMNEGWSPTRLPTLLSDDIDRQLSMTSDKIQSTIGRRPTLMRPPNGANGPTVTSIAGEQGMSVVLWDVDTLDWQQDSTFVRNTAIDISTPGAIVLMHTTNASAVDALPGIISGLKAKGYAMVTVSDLIGDPQPGEIYSRRP